MEWTGCAPDVLSPHEARTGPALPLHRCQGCNGSASPGRLTDRAINLGNAGIKVGDGVGV
jgi:hypothetical protein